MEEWEMDLDIDGTINSGNAMECFFCQTNINIGMLAMQQVDHCVNGYLVVCGMCASNLHTKDFTITYKEKQEAP